MSSSGRTRDIRGNSALHFSFYESIPELGDFCRSFVGCDIKVADCIHLAIADRT